MKNKSITCVVPTLNSAKTLEPTLLSLNNQVGVDIEVTVVDSGSTDGTLDICQRWNIQVIYAPPGNMYRAINSGIQRSNSEWVCYLNSDDLVFIDSLARLIDSGTTHNADICYGDCDYIDDVGRFVYSFCSAYPNELLPLFRCKQMGFAQQTAIYRRSLFNDLNGFDESFYFRADADFFIRALLAGRRAIRLPAPSVACFRLHSGQFSNQGLIETELEAGRIFGRAELKPSLYDQLIHTYWKLRNTPHYLIRILRESTLSHRIRLPRAIESYDHK